MSQSPTTPTSSHAINIFNRKSTGGGSGTYSPLSSSPSSPRSSSSGGVKVPAIVKRNSASFMMTNNNNNNSNIENNIMAATAVNAAPVRFRFQNGRPHSGEMSAKLSPSQRNSLSSSSPSSQGNNRNSDPVLSQSLNMLSSSPPVATSTNTASTMTSSERAERQVSVRHNQNQKNRHVVLVSASTATPTTPSTASTISTTPNSSSSSSSSQKNQQSSLQRDLQRYNSSARFSSVIWRSSPYKPPAQQLNHNHNSNAQQSTCNTNDNNNNNNNNNNMNNDISNDNQQTNANGTKSLSSVIQSMKTRNQKQYIDQTTTTTTLNNSNSNLANNSGKKNNSSYTIHLRSGSSGVSPTNEQGVEDQFGMFEFSDDFQIQSVEIKAAPQYFTGKEESLSSSSSLSADSAIQTPKKSTAVSKRPINLQQHHNDRKFSVMRPIGFSSPMTSQSLNTGVGATGGGSGAGGTNRNGDDSEADSINILYQHFLQQSILKERQLLSQQQEQLMKMKSLKSQELAVTSSESNRTRKRSFSMYDHDQYKTKENMKSELGDLIARLNDFENKVRGMVLVTTIQSSDSKIMERTTQLESLRMHETGSTAFFLMNSTTAVGDHEYSSPSAIENSSMLFHNDEDNDKITIIKVDLTAGVIREEVVTNNPSTLVDNKDGDNEDSDDDDMNEDKEDDDIRMEFDEEVSGSDATDVDVSGEENFLLNVNPSDKLEFIHLDGLLENCLVPLAFRSQALQHDELLGEARIANAHREDYKFYVQVLSTSISTILHIHSVDVVIQKIENILKTWESRNETDLTHEVVINRALVLVGEWVFYGSYLFPVDFLARLLNVIEPYLRQPQYIGSSTELVQRLFKLRHILYLREQAQENILKSIGNTPRLNILRIDMLKLSMELTLIEYDLFQMVQPHEFFASSWMKGDKVTIAPNLTAIIQCYNLVSQWVVETILNHKDVNERYKVLCRFISLAWNCVSVRNYNTCFAIISGLYTTPIHRLKKTWAMLNEDYTKLVEKLMFISNVSANYKNYRNELLKAKTPCIPNIAVHLKDFASLDDAQVDEREDCPGMLNISKRHAMAVLVRSLLRYQQYPFSFKSNSNLRDLVWNELLTLINPSETVKARSSRHLELSREIEPPPKKK